MMCVSSSKCLLLLMVVVMAKSIANNNDGCNEMVCGSVVSKCLLTESCQCKLNDDCHCCKDCLHCLGDLYTECCGCVDMCPKNTDALISLSPRSEIGDIDGGVPELFNTLTEIDDDEQWSTIRFQMRRPAGSKRRLEISEGLSVAPTVNCTVIYLNDCIGSVKCQKHCESMGASSYRWFHDGCCECVGANCLNYGINENRCIACSGKSSSKSLNNEDIGGYDDDGFEPNVNFNGGNNGNGDDESAAADDDDDGESWYYGEDDE